MTREASHPHGDIAREMAAHQRDISPPAILRDDCVPEILTALRDAANAVSNISEGIGIVERAVVDYDPARRGEFAGRRADIMAPLRAPILGLMGAVMACAVNFAVMRSIDSKSQYALGHFMFATGILPMASVLILLGVMSLGRRRLAPFVFGFELAGWVVVFAFLTLYSVAMTDLLRGVGVIGDTIRPIAGPWFEKAPSWAANLAECIVATVLFTIPELLVALLGGWLLARFGYTVRLESARLPTLPEAGAPAADIAESPELSNAELSFT
jgi:hypothetical protein